MRTFPASSFPGSRRLKLVPGHPGTATSGNRGGLCPRGQSNGSQLGAPGQESFTRACWVRARSSWGPLGTWATSSRSAKPPGPLPVLAPSARPGWLSSGSKGFSPEAGGSSSRGRVLRGRSCRGRGCHPQLHMSTHVCAHTHVPKYTDTCGAHAHAHVQPGMHTNMHRGVHGSHVHTRMRTQAHTLSKASPGSRPSGHAHWGWVPAASPAGGQRPVGPRAAAGCGLRGAPGGACPPPCPSMSLTGRRPHGARVPGVAPRPGAGGAGGGCAVLSPLGRRRRAPRAQNRDRGLPPAAGPDPGPPRPARRLRAPRPRAADGLAFPVRLRSPLSCQQARPRPLTAGNASPRAGDKAALNFNARR